MDTWHLLIEVLKDWHPVDAVRQITSPLPIDYCSNWQ